MNIFNHSYKELGTAQNLLAYARACCQLPGMVLLESRKGADDSRYDILAARPKAMLKLDDFGGDLSQWMLAIEAALDGGQSCAKSGAIAIGFVDYDSAAQMAIHPQQSLDMLGTPGVAGKSSATCGIYDWCLKRDRIDGTVTLHCSPQLSEEERQIIDKQISMVEHQPLTFSLSSRFQHHTSREQYLRDIASIRDYIGAGDCYQVNYAQRFSAAFSGEPLAAYEVLRNIAPGDFSALLALRPNQAVLSLSPERFLSVSGGCVITQPIKGTRPRHPDPKIDQTIARELQKSLKDCAENVMITDLLRNDLGRLCVPGSVTTTELCQLYSYENVHHLVSKIEGKLQPGVSAGQLLVGCSPGGSITGAPKRRAMEIIAELEQHPRGVYCGSVFALDASGRLESSIAIRTLEVIDEHIHCWGGGGITFDSDAESEYQETFDKVGAFLKALEMTSHALD